MSEGGEAWKAGKGGGNTDLAVREQEGLGGVLPRQRRPGSGVGSQPQETPKLSVTGSPQ